MDNETLIIDEVVSQQKKTKSSKKQNKPKEDAVKKYKILWFDKNGYPAISLDGRSIIYVKTNIKHNVGDEIEYKK